MLRLMINIWTLRWDRSEGSQRHSFVVGGLWGLWLGWKRGSRSVPLEWDVDQRQGRGLRHLGGLGLDRLDTKKDARSVVTFTCLALNLDGSLHCAETCFGIEGYPTVQTT
jgi:hypothetical protein